MNSEHIQTDTVKQYLLGTLPDHEAAAVEESYFANPLLFRQIREAEIELICAYLDGTLKPEAKTQFENQVQKVAALRELVDKVRVRRAASAVAPARPGRLLPALATAFVVVPAVAALVYFHVRQQPQQKAAVQPETAGIHLFLEPGVTMGAESQTKLLKIPRLVQPIFLTAELPGQKSSADYIAHLKRIDGDRSQSVVWSSAPTRSEPRKGGQQITITPDSSLFSPGDYILEMEMQGGPVRETYVFRAIASPL